MKTYTVNEFIDYTREHPADWINYCEILILRNGLILLAHPSHSERAILYAVEQEGKSRYEIQEELRKDLVNPLHYYVDKYDMVAVWYEYIIVPEDSGYNRFQKHALDELKRVGLISSNLVIEETAEYTKSLRRRDLMSHHE